MNESFAGRLGGLTEKGSARIHQNQLGGNAADGPWHEGHIASVRPEIQTNAPQEVLDWDASSIAYNKSRGYNE